MERRKRKRKNACSNCGRVGHNKVTCKNIHRPNPLVTELGRQSALLTPRERDRRWPFEPPRGFEDWETPNLNMGRLLKAMRRINTHVPRSWDLPIGRKGSAGTSDEQFDRKQMWPEKIRLNKYP